MFLSVCACVFFFDIFKLYQFVLCDLCVCAVDSAVDSELLHSLFVSQMPIPPNTLELFWYCDKVLDHPL